jgi:hypothetical protein
MWNDKKPWWSKKADENKGLNTHRKDWCVIKVATGFKPDINTWEGIYFYEYRAVAKSNAPKWYDPARGKYEANIEVDNLTKHEAHCVAKGLNFLDN